MSEKIAPLSLGFQPEAAVSSALLLQSEYSTYLTFNAKRQDSDPAVAVGRAVIEFDSCFITKFGYPNDEAWFGIPRTKELSYDCYEVLDSEWIEEITRLNRYSFPDTPAFNMRHFLFLFQDSSFECLASDLEASLTEESLAAVLARLSAKIAAE